MTNPTQQQKTLAIAKAMYGNTAVEVNALGEVLLPIEVGQHGKRPFNPYTSAEDSQAVQEFFKINTEFGGEYVTANTQFRLQVKTALDLKKAIADCAYEVVKEK